MANNTTPYGRQNVQWPDLGSSPGATLHGQVTAGIAYLSNNITARWSGSLTLAAGATVQITHNFGASLSALKIFVVESGAVLTEALQNASYTFTEISTSVVQVQNTTAGSKTFQVYIFPSKLNIRAADLDAAITITTTGNVTAANIKATTTLKTDDDNLELNSNAAGTGTDYKATITRGGSQSANATITLPSSTSTLATLAGTETLTNKTVTGVVVSDFEDLTHVSTPANPASGKLRFYAKADNKLYVKDSTGTESVVGSGSGSGTKNYLSRYFEGDKVVGTVSTVAVGGAITVSGSFPDVTSAWYANTSSGSSAIAVSTDNTLRGTKNFLTAIADQTTPLSGDTFIQTPAFNIDGSDLGKALTLEFDVSGVTTDGYWDVVVARYNSSGTFQELIPVAGNASASTSTPSAKLPTGVAKFSGFFITSSTASDVYTIRFRRLYNTGSTQIRIDSVTVGPNISLQGAIVTDWISYTPTYTGLGNPNTTFAQYRRVGSNLEIMARITIGTPTAVEAKISLPTGLTTSISTSTALVGYGTRNTSGAIDYYMLCGTSGADYLAIGRTSASEGGFSRLNGSIAFSGSEDFVFSASIPISQWQANTTSAARAVEEYVYNTSTTDADDSSAFGYGSSGVAGVISTTALTAARKKRVQFQTSIQPTDIIFVEIYNGLEWVKLESILRSTSAFEVQPLALQNATAYGIGLVPVSGSTTQIDVYFGQYAAHSGATYGAAGTGWNTLTSGIKWRVRKVSGGAAIGYPVSARNVVGDTSGNAVPAGYIGELVTATNTSAFTTSSTSYTNVTSMSLSLTAGTWLIFASSQMELGMTATGATDEGYTTARLYNSTASATLDERSRICYRFFASSTEKPASNYAGFVDLFSVTNLTTTSTIVMQIRCVQAVGTPTLTAGLNGVANGGQIVMRAIRIA